jgi:hypothetical protein
MTSENEVSPLRKALRQHLEDAVYIAAVMKGVDESSEYRQFWSRDSKTFFSRMEKNLLEKMQKFADRSSARWRSKSEY